MKKYLANLANSLDKSGSYSAADEVTMLLRKIAISPRLQQLKEELMMDPEPLKKLMQVYLEAQNVTEDSLTKLFQGDAQRAKMFAENYPDYVPDNIEKELVEEFGQELVDYYLFGIGTDDNYLVVDDVQSVLLDLLEKHRKLVRRRDKRQIKERFGIYTF